MKTFLKQFERFLAHRFWGVIIFLVMMWLMFYATFYLGAFPKIWIEVGVSKTADFCKYAIANHTFSDFLAHGVIEGIGSVLVFLPNIMVLFFFISLYQQTGLSQRFSLLMDKLMHGIGLHGSSFVPLLMGFGCNVPAILGTKMIPRKTDRLVTMLMIPFISCSARLPVYILLIGAFFSDYPLLILMLLYLSGIILAILTAFIINKFIFKPQKENSERYRCQLFKPKMKPILKTVWEAALEYLKKIGTVVLVAVIAVWFLNYYPRPHAEEKVHKSYLAKIGETVSPLFAPLGFDWKMSVSLVAGLPAKEFIVSTMSVLYNAPTDDYQNDVTIKERLKNEVYVSGAQAGKPIFNRAVALSFLFFSLLYMPCIGSIVTIYKESKSLKWALFTTFYTISLAWIVSFVVYRISLWFYHIQDYTSLSFH